MKRHPEISVGLEGQKNRVAKDAAEELAEAKVLKEQIDKVTVEMKAKSGEGGRLIGSIQEKQIAEALNKTEGIKVDRRKMELPDEFAQWALRMFQSRSTRMLRLHLKYM